MVTTVLPIVRIWDPKMHHKILIQWICSPEGLMKSQYSRGMLV